MTELRQREAIDGPLQPVGYDNPLFTRLVDSSGNPLLTADGPLQGDVNNLTSAQIASILDALAVGRYNATLPTLTDGRFNALQVGARGGLHVVITEGSSQASIGGFPAADALVAASYNGLATGAFGLGFGGTTWDRLRTADAAVAATGVLKVEQKYSYGRVTADGQIKATAGFVYSVSVAALTATPTAGMFTVYDAASETGTVIYSEWVFATDVGHTIQLNVAALTGIYVGFDATLANVQITVAYR